MILFFFLYGIHCVLVIGFHFVFRREVVLGLVCSMFVSDSVLRCTSSENFLVVWF